MTQNEKIRKAFELEAPRMGYAKLQRDGDGYALETTQKAWIVWQAACRALKEKEIL